MSSPTDRIREALNVPARPVTERGLEGLYALPLEVIDIRTAAARSFVEGELPPGFPTDEDVKIALAEERRIYREYDSGRTGPTPAMAMHAALVVVAESRRPAAHLLGDDDE